MIKQYSKLFLSGIVIPFLLVTSCRKPTSPYVPSHEVIWEKVFGGTNSDWGKFAQETSDGGYIVVGKTWSYGSEGDIYLIKTNPSGDTIWTRTYGGGREDVGYSVRETVDGGYIITGYTYSFGAGDTDVYLIRTNINGDTIWTRTYGGESTDKGREVLKTSDGGYIIIGDTKSFGLGLYSDVYLIKIDDNGDIVWEKVYGGNGIDVGWSIVQSVSGDFVIAGYSNSFGNGDLDVYLIKVNENGDTVWTKTYGKDDADFGFSIQETYKGEYIISGGTCSTTEGDMNFYLIKTDENGDTLWTKSFGGTNYDISYSIIETARRSYILAGNTESFGAGYNDIYLIETDTNGNVMWEETYGGMGVDVCNSIEEVSDGGYILIGSTVSYGAGVWDVYLIKIR
ncbi:hypothetical protein KAX75_01755 [candidate division WOR-3 bacterium]|nr:hypothetical protein [candidate division WOR-3 bacterium]